MLLMERLGSRADAGDAAAGPLADGDIPRRGGRGPRGRRLGAGARAEATPRFAHDASAGGRSGDRARPTGAHPNGTAARMTAAGGGGQRRARAGRPSTDRPSRGLPAPAPRACGTASAALAAATALLPKLPGSRATLSTVIGRSTSWALFVGFPWSSYWISRTGYPTPVMLDLAPAVPGPGPGVLLGAVLGESDGGGGGPGTGSGRPPDSTPARPDVPADLGLDQVGSGPRPTQRPRQGRQLRSLAATGALPDVSHGVPPAHDRRAAGARPVTARPPRPAAGAQAGSPRPRA
jgi:hypothetical protein